MTDREQGLPLPGDELEQEEANLTPAERLAEDFKSVTDAVAARNSITDEIARVKTAAGWDIQDSGREGQMLLAIRHTAIGNRVNPDLVVVFFDNIVTEVRRRQKAYRDSQRTRPQRASETPLSPPGLIEKQKAELQNRLQPELAGLREKVDLCNAELVGLVATCVQATDTTGKLVAPNFSLSLETSVRSAVMQYAAEKGVEPVLLAGLVIDIFSTLRQRSSLQRIRRIGELARSAQDDKDTKG